MTDRLTIRRPDDWHVHLRDGEMLAAVARLYRAAVRARDRHAQSHAAGDERRGGGGVSRPHPGGAAADAGFTPLMTCYLTDDADADEIARGYAAGVFAACKLYPAHATTNSAHGVTDIFALAPVLERDAGDRHAAADPRRSHRPRRRHLRSRGGVHRPHADPAGARLSRAQGRARTYHHRRRRRFRARGRAATSPRRSPRSISSSTATRCSTGACARTLIACRWSSASGIGSRCARRRCRGRRSSSWAPTARRTRSARRRADCGCAGIFNAPFALESYLAVFEEEGALDRFEGFASEHGARFYGLPLNEGTVTLERVDGARCRMRVAGLVPFQAGGDDLAWRMVGVSTTTLVASGRAEPTLRADRSASGMT